METHGDQSPAIGAGRDAIVIYGATPLQIAEMIAVATGRAVADAAEARRELREMERRLGVTEGAARAMLRSLDQADVPIERLPQALGELAARHKELLERLRWMDADDPVVARLREEARAAAERGDYDGADRLLREAEAEDLAAEQRMRERLERRRLTRAETLAQRADLAALRFRYAEAERLLREAAGIVPEGEPLRLARYLTGAAHAAWRGGAYVEAEPLLRRALAIREAALGPEHPEVAASLSNLATVLLALSRPAEAEPLRRRAVALAERAHGPDHPEVARSLDKLAEMLRKLDRPAEAVEPLRRVLAIREAALPPQDPSVTVTRDSLAGLLRELGRAAEAELLLRRALAIREAAHGDNHPELAVALDDLVMTLRGLDLRRSAKRHLHRDPWQPVASRVRRPGCDHRRPAAARPGREWARSGRVVLARGRASAGGHPHRDSGRAVPCGGGRARRDHWPAGDAARGAATPAALARKPQEMGHGRRSETVGLEPRAPTAPAEPPGPVPLKGARVEALGGGVPAWPLRRGRRGRQRPGPHPTPHTRAGVIHVDESRVKGSERLPPVLKRTAAGRPGMNVSVPSPRNGGIDDRNR